MCFKNILNIFFILEKLSFGAYVDLEIVNSMVVILGENKVQCSKGNVSCFSFR